MKTDHDHLGDWPHRLAGQFRSAWPARDRAARKLGREAEHPLVEADGTVGDIARVWPHLAALPGAEVHREGDLIVGVELPGALYSAEVGKGTIEVIVGPEPDLIALGGRYEDALANVLTAASAEGQRVLGHGIQPVTVPSEAVMTAKQRYLVMLEQIGPRWLWFAVTASDQVHVDVAADEVVAATNLANLMTPAVIALCANSGVAGGLVCAEVSVREASMGAIGAQGHRHGMPRAPVDDVEGWIGLTLPLDHLMHRVDGESRAMHGTFLDWLTAGPHTDADAYQAWLWHEHYIWNSARPRAAHGTVELRAACQQPGHEHAAAAVLSTGIVAAHVELAAYAAHCFGADAWPVMRQWHRDVVRGGLAAPEPMKGWLEGVLDRVEQGLVGRGHGEAALMAPLRRRLAARSNPAQDAQALLRDQGLPALIDALAI